MPETVRTVFGGKFFPFALAGLDIPLLIRVIIFHPAVVAVVGGDSLVPVLPYGTFLIVPEPALGLFIVVIVPIQIAGAANLIHIDTVIHMGLLLDVRYRLAAVIVYDKIPDYA